MARELEIGRWMMRFALYGDESVVDHRFEKIKEALRADPRRRGLGAEARAGRDRRRSSIPFERVQGGVPNLELNQMTGWYGGEEGGHIGFSPVAPLTGTRRRRRCVTCCAGSSRRRQGSTTRRS